MNKTQLIESIANKTNDISKKDIESVIKGFTESVIEAMEQGDSLSLIGFGTFSVRERAARVGRNPKTGEELQISASKSIGFKQGKDAKERLNKS